MKHKLVWCPEEIEFVFDSYHGLEDRLLKFLSTVPYIGNDNKNTWSHELVSLFIDICSMIDSLSRHMIGNGGGTEEKVEVLIEKGKKQDKKIKDLKVNDFELNLWWPIGLDRSFVVIYLFSRFPNCAFSPFASGYRTQKDSDPLSPRGWWDIYNSLKHNRLRGYRKANLGNTIASLSALFLLLVRYKDIMFTRALVRRGWVDVNTMPEFIHEERDRLWYDSELFGTHDDPRVISSTDIKKINARIGSKKFYNFRGVYNN